MWRSTHVWQCSRQPVGSDACQDSVTSHEDALTETAMQSLQALGPPSIVLSPIASLDTSPKILKVGPDRKLYYGVGPACDQSSACQCGGAVAGSPQVQYCSIARVSLDGSGAASRITGMSSARAAMRLDAKPSHVACDVSGTCQCAATWQLPGGLLDLDCSRFIG